MLSEADKLFQTKTKTHHKTKYILNLKETAGRLSVSGEKLR